MNENNFAKSVDQASQSAKRFTQAWESLLARATLKECQTREQYDVAWGRFWSQMTS